MLLNRVGVIAGEGTVRGATLGFSWVRGNGPLEIFVGHLAMWKGLLRNEEGFDLLVMPGMGSGVSSGSQHAKPGGGFGDWVGIVSGIWEGSKQYLPFSQEFEVKPSGG